MFLSERLHSARTVTPNMQTQSVAKVECRAMGSGKRGSVTLPRVMAWRDTLCEEQTNDSAMRLAKIILEKSHPICHSTG